jgi:hypothetical protein
MKSLYYTIPFILWFSAANAAVTDVSIMQRDTGTTFVERIITGSTNVGKVLGFDVSGELVALTQTGGGGSADSFPTGGNYAANTTYSGTMSAPATITFS